jgi:transcriptional regulator with GAF, ATPase, and Fis domain
LEKIVTKLVRYAEKDPSIACVQIWLIEKGDICSTCAQRPKCPDQTRCLHLAAEGGKLRSGFKVADTRFDDSTARIPLGFGAIGQLAVTKQQIILRDLDRRPEQMPEVGWLKQEEVHEFSGSPILFRGEALGVSAAFIRAFIPHEAQLWGQIFADQIGASIANARAFEEIQRLKAQLEQQNTYLMEEVAEAKAFGDLVGQSAALRQIVSQIDLVAPTEASVLILGDTGTGKDLVAHEIHRRSRRKDNPLVRVNCASIPKDLFESEFFGHVKGAFTGAIKDRPGRFETADGGTLFLDEIGEVPLEMQGKLLRVLQEKYYERVGEDRTRRADVRIIGATNRDLKKEVAAGRFREDLYYRLHVFPIQVTTLKERKDDIPLLAKHFVDLSVKELRCPPPRLTRAAVARLQNYDWPGNVRELRNVIEHAVILARGGLLDFDLPVPEAKNVEPRAMPRDGTVLPEPEYFTEAELVRRAHENLLVILKKTNGKLRGPDGAAELLGVKPTTLFSRMKKMGIKRANK